MSSWARTWRTTLRGQCPLERASIRAVSTWLRAARDQRRETLPGLFQQLRVIYDSTCQGRREEGGWRVNRGEVRGYFSACQPSQPASFYFLPFFKRCNFSQVNTINSQQPSRGVRSLSLWDGLDATDSAAIERMVIAFMPRWHAQIIILPDSFPGPSLSDSHP